MTQSFPSQAQYVVIGGGIVGCSTAYHLARDHNADVVLIERDRLTSGSTWHAAGLVGQLRSSAAITQLLRYSVELYEGLEAETGLATGWKASGAGGWTRVGKAPRSCSDTRSGGAAVAKPEGLVKDFRRFPRMGAARQGLNLWKKPGSDP